MLVVTLKLANPPATGDDWLVSAGAETPFATYSPEWWTLGHADLDKPIVAETDESIRFLRVGVRIKGVPGWTYLFETTTPFTFTDKATYTWDCSTNSLTGEAPAPVPGKFIVSILSFVLEISDWFYNAYLETKGWIIVGPLFSSICLSISDVFWKLLLPIVYFGDWVDDVAAKVANIMSSVDIISLLKTWLTYAEDAWDWVRNATTNVVGIIQPLLASISTSIATLQTTWDIFSGKIPSLEELVLWWRDWWGKILAPLTIWWNGRLKEVDTLIDSTLKRWFPNYDDLVKLWADTRLFFTAPLDWLWEQFTDWFLGRE